MTISNSTSLATKYWRERGRNLPAVPRSLLGPFLSRLASCLPHVGGHRHIHDLTLRLAGCAGIARDRGCECRRFTGVRRVNEESTGDRKFEIRNLMLEKSNIWSRHE